VIVRVEPDGVVRLLEADDFRNFSIAMPDTDVARVGLASVARLDGRDHVWFAPDRVRTLAGSTPLPADWDQRFAGMVAYAASKGWTDGVGAMRGHIVYD
jgi:hypothetical protein